MDMETAQAYSRDAGYGIKQPTVGQIHDVRFHTNEIVRKFERKSSGGWEERQHELLETLPFDVMADIGGEKVVVRGSVKYSSASREEMINHGRSYRGKHVEFGSRFDIPDIIYGGFSSKSTRLYEIRTITD